MAKVLVLLADGSEEMEAVITIDVLRRAQQEVCAASVMGRKRITASRNVKIEADALLADCINETWDMVVLPGGMPGAQHLHDSMELRDLLHQQREHKRWLAAICAAPAVVLGRHNLIADATATCYPSFQQELASKIAKVDLSPVVVDDKLITSQGPGTAMSFALELVRALAGPAKAQEVAQAMVFPWPRS